MAHKKYFLADELEDRFKDINTTAYNFRKNLIDPLLEYTCNSDNATGCNKTKGLGMEIRGRAINLNVNGGLDLVFVIDASSSVKKGTDFKSGLEFAKELVRTIGVSKRYGSMTHCSQSVVLFSRVLNCIQGIERPFKVFVSLQGYVHCLQS